MKALAALFLIPWFAHAGIAVPPGGHRVTDLTGTLTGAEVAQLADTLQALERDTGAQIDVLVVPSTDGEPIEQYALRVAEAWKPGRKKVDDGIVFLLAKNDRKVRIEVGYGLEGTIPDVVAKRILREQVSPRFKEGQWAQGLTAGVTAMANLIRAAHTPAAPRPLASAPAPSPAPGIATGLLILLIMLPLAVAGGVLYLLFRRKPPEPAFEFSGARQRPTFDYPRTRYVPSYSGPTRATARMRTRSSYSGSNSGWAAPVTPSRRGDDDSSSRSSSFGSDSNTTSSSGGGSFGGGGASDSF